jgi:adenosylhomocysteine nucleosidase
MIAVTFALPAESSQFLRRLRNRSGADRNGIRVIRGTVDDCMIEVLHTGVGEKICTERIGKFLQDQQLDFLISAGFAGALNDQLQPNEILLAKNFSTIDLKQAQPSFSGVFVHTADLVTLSALIDSSKDRKQIARTTGAAAVDMETEFIAHACNAHGIPLLGLRVITDTPSQPFPAPPHVLFDIEQQRTHLTALAKFFLTHPNRVPGLVQFTRRIARARRTLASALIEVTRNVEL